MQLETRAHSEQASVNSHSVNTSEDESAHLPHVDSAFFNKNTEPYAKNLLDIRTSTQSQRPHRNSLLQTEAPDQRALDTTQNIRNKIPVKNYLKGVLSEVSADTLIGGSLWGLAYNTIGWLYTEPHHTDTAQASTPDHWKLNNAVNSKNTTSVWGQQATTIASMMLLSYVGWLAIRPAVQKAWGVKLDKLNPEAMLERFKNKTGPVHYQHQLGLLECFGDLVDFGSFPYNISTALVTGATRAAVTQIPAFKEDRFSSNSWQQKVIPETIAVTAMVLAASIFGNITKIKSGTYAPRELHKTTALQYMREQADNKITWSDLEKPSSFPTSKKLTRHALIMLADPGAWGTTTMLPLSAALSSSLSKSALPKPAKDAVKGFAFINLGYIYDTTLRPHFKDHLNPKNPFTSPLKLAGAYKDLVLSSIFTDETLTKKQISITHPNPLHLNYYCKHLGDKITEAIPPESIIKPYVSKTLETLKKGSILTASLEGVYQVEQILLPHVWMFFVAAIQGAVANMATTDYASATPVPPEKPDLPLFNMPHSLEGAHINTKEAGPKPAPVVPLPVQLIDETTSMWSEHTKKQILSIESPPPSR